MTRSIVLETETVEKENQCDWKKLDVARKEDLVNNHFMPADVRLHYEHERAASCCSFTSSRSADGLLGPGSASQGVQYEDELVVENRPQHLSQPGSWDHPQRSRSTKDLVYENEWSSKYDVSASIASSLSLQLLKSVHFNLSHTSIHCFTCNRDPF